MEVFIIDGRQALQLKKNKEMTAYLGPEEKAVTKEKLKHYSAFRLRKKTFTTIVYLNIMNRRRMLKLIGENKQTN